jgi:methylmalonyl-CoA mutase cobalamin-binding domain/chain
MTHEEILTALYDDTLVGNAPAVKENVEKGLEDGMDPESMLYDALIPSLEEVGARFERGDYFVPEMLIAARAMQGALDILRPLLAESGAKPIGKFLMGTVKGDVHDIGKNLCNIMLEGAGFEVIDLGVNVPPERFVEQINEHAPDIVGFSAFLTTTMPMFKANINALEKGGIRENVIVMVGGAPVTQEYADAVGADGYSADASSAVKMAKDLIEKRRSAVPAKPWTPFSAPRRRRSRSVRTSRSASSASASTPRAARSSPKSCARGTSTRSSWTRRPRSRRARTCST